MAKMQARCDQGCICKDRFWIVLGESVYHPFKVIRRVDTPFAFVKGPYTSQPQAIRDAQDLNKPFCMGRKYQVERDWS